MRQAGSVRRALKLPACAQTRGGKEETITMPTVSAFHRDREGEKYHDNSQCGPGSEIPVKDRVPGKGGKDHCDVCADLNAKGK
jgi:hypothetical protein